MTKLRTRNPSIYFIFHVLNRYFPESNTITRIERYKDYYIITAENRVGDPYIHRRIKEIPNPDLHLQAYQIDFLMRLAGQGRCNITISEGECYTNWKTFSNDIEDQIKIARYNEVVIGSLYLMLGDINSLVFEVQERYNVDLSHLSSILSSIWKY